MKIFIARKCSDFAIETERDCHIRALSTEIEEEARDVIILRGIPSILARNNAISRPKLGMPLEEDAINSHFHLCFEVNIGENMGCDTIRCYHLWTILRSVQGGGCAYTRCAPLLEQIRYSFKDGGRLTFSMLAYYS